MASDSKKTEKKRSNKLKKSGHKRKALLNKNGTTKSKIELFKIN